MSKKVWLGFIAAFVAMVVLELIIHGFILGSTYRSDELARLWRPDMESKMWIMYVVYVIMSFFLSLIFSKGYEGKGIGEGFRFGLYVGLLLATPMAYSSYAIYPIPYSLAFQWFIYGLIEYIIIGILLALVFGKTRTAPVVMGEKKEAAVT